MLIFLKLGGSLITDKTLPYTPRITMLDELAIQISKAIKKNPSLQLVLGHGSGSFGHHAAKQFGTRKGVSGKNAWRGFSEVWYQASTLNRLVVDALRKANLPVVTLAPFSAVMARNGMVTNWNLTPLRACLANNLLPVIHGDVVFDEVLGGTILSTEDLFIHLALHLMPARILLAGLEVGVWKDFPARKNLLTNITPETFREGAPSLGGSTGADVTGGMLAKVTDMLKLVQQVKGLEVLIFSGEDQENTYRALLGDNPGTRLSN
jgi:isopentenyl phosphate kinase